VRLLQHLGQAVGHHQVRVILFPSVTQYHIAA
jgi:hypothetical protein